VGMLPDYYWNEEDRSFDLQVTYFRIGRALQGITGPGESLTRNGLPVKEAMVAKYRMYMGLVRSATLSHTTYTLTHTYTCAHTLCRGPAPHSPCADSSTFARPYTQSTNSIGYLVPSDEWVDGQYEENVSIDREFGDTTRDLQIALVQSDNANLLAGPAVLV
jgi:hypothetical protein